MRGYEGAETRLIRWYRSQIAHDVGASVRVARQASNSLGDRGKQPECCMAMVRLVEIAGKGRVQARG